MLPQTPPADQPIAPATRVVRAAPNGDLLHLPHPSRPEGLRARRRDGTVVLTKNEPEADRLPCAVRPEGQRGTAVRGGRRGEERRTVAERAGRKEGSYPPVPEGFGLFREKMGLPLAEEKEDRGRHRERGRVRRGPRPAAQEEVQLEPAVDEDHLPASLEESLRKN